MSSLPPIPPPDGRHEMRSRLMLGIMSALAAVFLAIVLVVFLLPRIAPPPIEFKNNPSPIASNPNDPDHWNFSNNDPVFHPGDALIVQVLACISDPFGGPSIHVSGYRRLISVQGNVSDSLDASDVVVATRPCGFSKTNVGQISTATPTGTYRIEANVKASTALYTRDSTWYTIWFEVENP